MSTVTETIARIRALFNRGQLNPAVLANVSADLTQIAEQLNDGQGTNVPGAPMHLCCISVR